MPDPDDPSGFSSPVPESGRRLTVEEQIQHKELSDKKLAAAQELGFWRQKSFMLDNGISATPAIPAKKDYDPKSVEVSATIINSY